MDHRDTTDTSRDFSVLRMKRSQYVHDLAGTSQRARRFIERRNEHEWAPSRHRDCWKKTTRLGLTSLPGSSLEILHWTRGFFAGSNAGRPWRAFRGERSRWGESAMPELGTMPPSQKRHPLFIILYTRPVCTPHFPAKQRTLPCRAC